MRKQSFLELSRMVMLVSASKSSDSPIPGPVDWPVSSGVAGYAWHVAEPRGAVLIQHGYGDHTTGYVTRNNHLVLSLLERGLSVFGFDMPGNGSSAGRPGSTDVVESVKLHRRARSLLPIDLPSFVFGHSLGGLVTASSVIEDQEGIAGMVLLAPAIKYDVGPVTRAITRIGAWLVPDLAGPLPAGTLESLTNDEALGQMMTTDPQMYLGRVRWVTLGTAAPLAHANWKLYAGLEVPLLAVHGTADENTDPQGSRELVEVARSRDKSLHLVEGGKHALLDDTDRDHTSGVVLDWIDERAGSSRGDPLGHS